MIQLAQLDAARVDAQTDTARNEIHTALRAAAQAVLTDINAALRRIERGSYGRCQRCGIAISLDRLSALPMAPLCGSCQRTEEMPGIDPTRGRVPARRTTP